MLNKLLYVISYISLICCILSDASWFTTVLMFASFCWCGFDVVIDKEKVTNNDDTNYHSS